MIVRPQRKRIVMLFFCTAIVVVLGAMILRLLMPPIENQVILSGSGMTYFQGSRSTAVLLLHGLSATPAELEPIAHQLRLLNYTVYTPILRGHGTEPSDLKLVTWKDWYEQSEQAYFDLRDTHDKVYVGGISLGGDLALLIAANHRDVDGVIAIGAPIALRNKKTYLSRLLEPVLPFVAHPVEEDERDRYYQSLPSSSLVELIDLMSAVRANLRNIQSPVLLIQATDDPTIEPSSAQYILDHVKSDERTLRLYDVNSHVVIDNPALSDKVFRDIEDFIT